MGGCRDEIRAPGGSELWSAHQQEAGVRIMPIEVTPAVIPHLVVGDAAAAIDFYVKAFGATELGRVPGPDGKLIHAALTINGSTVMLNDDFPEFNDGKSTTPTALGGTPVTIHLTVTDVDAKFQQALDAGATVVAALEDQFWGRSEEHPSELQSHVNLVCRLLLEKKKQKKKKQTDT